MDGAGAFAGIDRIAVIGNYPPRLCGIATFTFDVVAAMRSAFPAVAVDAYAMEDGDSARDYPAEVVCSVAQDDIADYRAAARRINASGADVVLVQHEYGIFGGPAGSLLLNLLDRVEAPVVATLHTVLEHPDIDQRQVLDELARRAVKIIVMAEKGRDILMRIHGIARERIAVVPHGVPDRPFAATTPAKARFGFDDAPLLLTFGLLSPNKGIETMIRAMPAIVAANPDVVYVVLGATHPHLVAREGETYREQLRALAAELGVSDHVRFVDTFVEQPLLLEWLEAADIYVTPYLNETQITSGTLSYAVGLGKPVVSTPYWHASELLGDGTGVLVPFGDVDGFAAAIGGLLAAPERLAAIRARAYAVGRTMTWSKLAEAYGAILTEATQRRMVRFPRVRTSFAPVPALLRGVDRLTDACGMIQHSIFSVPDRDHGYCVDDNARALMLMHEIRGAAADHADDLATVYASFVQHAWNGERGRFRNFMGYDRTWLEAEGSEDSFGRSLWSIGVTACDARRHDLRRWALHLFEQVAPHALALGSPRAWAFALFGADAVLEQHRGHPLAGRLVREFGERLMRQLSSGQREGWTWFEAVLGYDNARLPEALIRAGRRLGEPLWTEAGLLALDWLDAIQTNEAGQFRAVGSESFGRAYAQPLPYDQQPLEAWASMAAAELAYAATGDDRWVASAERAYRWYLGDNDVGLPIASLGDGGCFDGLMSDRANLNQGAESVLSFQFACGVAARMAAAGARASERSAGAAAS